MAARCSDGQAHAIGPLVRYVRGRERSITPAADAMEDSMSDLGLLLLRVVTGGLLAGHGAQKLFGWFNGPGLEGTGGWMEGMGLKPGRYWAMLAGFSEFG